MTLALQFTDGVSPYDLTWEGSIYFGEIQLGETKKLAVRVHNTDPNAQCTEVTVTPVAHPTDQIGTADDTYNACELSNAEDGVYTHSYNIGTLNPGEINDFILWIKWTIKEEQNPGIMRFALKATGRYEI